MPKTASPLFSSNANEVRRSRELVECRICQTFFRRIIFACNDSLSSFVLWSPTSRELRYPRTLYAEWVHRWNGGRFSSCWAWRRNSLARRDSCSSALRRLARLSREYGFDGFPWDSILKYLRFSASRDLVNVSCQGSTVVEARDFCRRGHWADRYEITFKRLFCYKMISIFLLCMLFSRLVQIRTHCHSLCFFIALVVLWTRRKWAKAIEKLTVIFT